MDILSGLFGSEGFLPHGHCYLWTPGLLWLNVVSDLLIGFAYFSIPCTLIYFVRKRPDVPFNWIFVAFGIFILACGTTHFMDVWTTWNPAYWLAGIVKAITAAASVPTAALLVHLVPKALLIPSQKQELINVNAELENEIKERKRAEERLQRIVESTPNAIVLVNREGRITLVNAQTENLFGYSRETLTGQPIEMLVPERFRAGHPGQRAGFFASPATRSMGAGRDLYGLRKDGREFPVEIGLNPMEADEGIQVLASIIDITPRKQAEESLRRLMQETHETVDVLVSSTSEILSAMAQVAAGSAQTATAVSETTVTVEEVKQTAQMANQKAQQVAEGAQRVSQVSLSGEKAVEETIQGMHRIHEQMESIAESVVHLSEQSQAIGEIIATVNDLAEQSNLLAVNAAIEAARAGEQGKSFAVVAQEMRSLAEQSKQATAQVRTILSDIQKATGTAVLTTEQGSKAVEAGVRQSAEAGDSIRVLAEGIEKAAQAATQIAASSQQQMVGMDQVALAMNNINQASAQNVAGTKQTEVAAQQLHELGQKLKQLVEQYKA